MEVFADELAPLAPEDVLETLEAHYTAFWGDAERHREWRARPLVESRRFIAAQAFEVLRAQGAAHLGEAMAHRLGEHFHSRREGFCRLFPGACAALDAVRAKGILMGLVTNGVSASQRAKLARFDLERRFDHIQIEGEHGFGKPEPRAYAHAMAALDVEAHETWMVGDNLEWEVAAPQRLGIFAVWHDGYRQGLPAQSTVRPDLIVHRISELLEHLP